MTARDLINGSMRLLGILGSGESPSANEATNALQSLNDMIDLWSNESLLIYANQSETFPLVPGQQSYTMGPSGNFNTTRPQKIESANLSVIGSPSTIELPLQILNQDQWSSIALKGTASNISTMLFAQGTFPLETIYLWPLPSTANNITIWSWKPLALFSTLDSVVSLPPGYSKTLRYNLALELAPEYGKVADELTVVTAEESKAAIKRTNTKPLYLSTDTALLPPRAFNYLTGE